MWGAPKVDWGTRPSVLLCIRTSNSKTDMCDFPLGAFLSLHAFLVPPHSPHARSVAGAISFEGVVSSKPTSQVGESNDD
jgi:hypothetical protein